MTNNITKTNSEDNMINNTGSIHNRIMLKPITRVLYEPSDADWSYCHHASLCCYDGRFWAIWSNGETNEDDIGQHVLCSVSEDGLKWEKPWVLFDSDGETLTAAGLYTYGGKLIAYAGVYGYSEDNTDNGHFIAIGTKHTDTDLICRVTEDGEHWSDAVSLGIPVVPNQGPQRLNSGRIILCGNVTFPTSDCPDGIHDWTIAGLEPSIWPDMYDDSEGFIIHKELRADKKFLCEGSYFQTDDDVIHMLLRSNEGILYCSESSDNGESWSPPEATEFTDCGAKFHCGRLPDGRFYIVGNPDPGPRCPLVISISENGEDFDRSFIVSNVHRPMRVPGLYKGGIYGYPHSMIVGENMHIICSVNKEDIYVFTVPLSQLT
ncbi:MAG: exo-alpha-sialidase [Eubacteriales bacterium]